MSAYEGGLHLVGDPADTNMLSLPLVSAAYTKGDCVFLADGGTSWGAVTSTTRQHTRKAVLQETLTDVAGLSGNAILCNTSQLWVAEAANDAVVFAHRGHRMAFTDGNTVNNSGTDVATSLGCFQQLSASGTLTDKRIIGQFVGLSGYGYSEQV